MVKFKAVEMTLQDVLKLLNEENYNVGTLAKEIEGISEKKVRSILKDNGFTFSNTGVKGWHYIGEPAKETTALNTVLGTVKPAPAKTPRKTANKQPVQDVKTEKDITPAPTEPTAIQRKRFTFELDTALMKQVKVYSVMNDVNMYELIENSVKEYLDKHK